MGNEIESHNLTPLAHRNGRVTVRQCDYAVPARFIGMKMRVKLRANEIWVFEGRGQDRNRVLVVKREGKPQAQPLASDSSF
ncbi:hypothetical protein [Streptomyces sp. NPDC007100]|uniref:hypothetical protein n=1 Tax=Streptomyces sp. NPDC007100 TaxID=3155602 RepID=UPI00340849F5